MNADPVTVIAGAAALVRIARSDPWPRRSAGALATNAEGGPMLLVGVVPRSR